MRLALLVLLLLLLLTAITLLRFAPRFPVFEEDMDVNTLRRSIRRLERILLAEKIGLAFFVFLLLLLPALHIVRLLNLLEPPFLWVMLFSVLMASLLQGAVFGVGRYKNQNYYPSASQEKLNYLRNLLKKAEEEQQDDDQR